MFACYKFFSDEYTSIACYSALCRAFHTATSIPPILKGCGSHYLEVNKGAVCPTFEYFTLSVSLIDAHPLFGLPCV